VENLEDSKEIKHATQIPEEFRKMKDMKWPRRTAEANQ
jgi:hypothetical protein